MRLTISSGNFDDLDSHSSIDIWCAVVPDLHDDFILTADAVSRLSQSDANIARVTTRNDGDSNDDTDCDTAAATVNTDDVDVVVTSVSDDENNVPVVQSEINHDTRDVDDTDTRRHDADDDNDDDDAITECNDDKSSLASCSEVAQEQRNDKSLIGCFVIEPVFVVKNGFVQRYLASRFRS